MNLSQIIKKVLPVILSIVLIVIIVVTASAITTSRNRAPQITNGSGNYIKITETINGKPYTYTMSRQELYDKLKTGIGLSSLITMINKDLLKEAKNDEGVTFWDSVKEEDVLESIKVAVYGEDVDPDKLDAEEKDKLEKDFIETMVTGYGYKADAIDSEDIKNHYRLVNAKKEYAKYALNKAVQKASGTDEPYYSDDDIEDYYDANYNRDYWALIVPFGSEAKAKAALQQLGVAIDTSDDRWVHVTVEEETEDVETDEVDDDGNKITKKVGTGVYKTVNGEPLTTREIIETFLKLTVMVYGYKDLPLVQGDYEIVVDEDGNRSYKMTDPNCDYIIVDIALEIIPIKADLAEVEKLIDDTEISDEDKETIYTYLDNIKIELEKMKDKLVSSAAISEALTLIADLERAIDPEDGAVEGTPTALVEKIIDKLEVYETETFIFNFDKEDSQLFYTYSNLYEYDSNLPSKLRSNYTTYTPFDSLNSKDASWYSVDIVSSSPAYYVLLKLNQQDPISLTDAKEEIISKMMEAEIDENYIETQMANLRNEYGLIIYDKEIQSNYLEALKSYEDAEFKKSGKRSDTLVAKVSKGSFTVEYSADMLYNYMENTSGMATAVSELAYQRLLFNDYFNIYKNFATKEWLGDEGKELRQSIIDQISNQRLYFLSGGYISYGYDPATMSWEDFLYQMNGATDEYNFADLLVYSSVASDYINKLTEFVKIDGEGLDLEFEMSYIDALNTASYELLEKRMLEILEDYLSANGEHFLVCMYETVNDALNSGTPVDPAEWNENSKLLAQELINEVNKYLQYSKGTYATALQELATAYDAAPYSVKDDEGNYVTIINDDNKKYEYFLETAEYKLDLAKYKSAGLYVKYESLGNITAGQMVERFEDAVREIWAKDIEDDVLDRLTIYDKPIESEFGYHLYINLSSQAITTYDQIVVDANGQVVYVEKDGEEVYDTIKKIIPNFFEIRLYIEKEALNALDTTDFTDAQLDELEDRIEAIDELLSSEAVTAITTYYSPVIAEFTNSYFSSIMQQKELLEVIKTHTIEFNSENYTVTDLENLITLNNKNAYTDNLTYLKPGDEDMFDISSIFIK